MSNKLTNGNLDILLAAAHAFGDSQISTASKMNAVAIENHCIDVYGARPADIGAVYLNEAIHNCDELYTAEMLNEEMIGAMIRNSVTTNQPIERLQALRLLNGKVRRPNEELVAELANQAIEKERGKLKP